MTYTVSGGMLNSTHSLTDLSLNLYKSLFISGIRYARIYSTIQLVWPQMQVCLMCMWSQSCVFDDLKGMNG